MLASRLPNVDDGLSKTCLLEHDWTDRQPEKEQLYDLTFDPHEARNLAAEPAMAPVLAQMRETDDPILDGLPLPLPPGARFNEPHHGSPNAPVTKPPG